jgi:hypothetical protein
VIDSWDLLHFILAFIVGSLWVVVATVASEKKGSVKGGILAGIPSTAALSFLFIGWAQSPTAAVQATNVFPLVFSITCAFPVLYAFFAQKGFAVGISVSLIIWFTVSGIIVVSGLKDFISSLVVGVTVSSVAYYFLVNRLRLENLAGEQLDYTHTEILERGMGAGSLVFLAVLLSQIGGPIIGGVASAFPAVFTSTLIVLYRSKGTEFSRAMAKPLVTSAILTVIPFCIGVRYLYPSLGIWLGTLACYALVAPLAMLSYFLMQHRQNSKGLPTRSN